MAPSEARTPEETSTGRPTAEPSTIREQWGQLIQEVFQPTSPKVYIPVNQALKLLVMQQGIQPSTK